MRNVLLLTFDACRKDAIGCYAKHGLTPFIDSIQGHCIRFNNAYSGGPYTQAGFPPILSSSYYLDFGRIRGTCPPARALVSQVLQNQGIDTAAFHSNAYLAAFFGWNRGWNVYYDSMEEQVSDRRPYISAWKINKRAIDWVNRHDEMHSDKPFFLWVHYMDMHEPYSASEEYLKKVDASLRISEDNQFDLFKNVLLKRDIFNTSDVEILRKVYLAKVVEVDAAARDLLESLWKSEHKEDIIIMTSDHGDEFNDHGGLSHDGKMFDELVNVPLIIYDPLLATNIVSDAIVSGVDIPPTITYLFGVSPSESWQGQSLLPLGEYNRKGAFAEALDKQGAHEKGNEPEVHMYREGNLKIIYHERNDNWELYDLENDPKEQEDIWGKDTTTEYLIKQITPRIGRYKK